MGGWEAKLGADELGVGAAALDGDSPVVRPGLGSALAALGTARWLDGDHTGAIAAIAADQGGYGALGEGGTMVVPDAVAARLQDERG